MEFSTDVLEHIDRAELELLIRGGALDAVIPEISALSGCTQSPASHAEGDAAVHTSYVVFFAQTMLRERPLSPDDRASLLWSALLHDWGKPFTREMSGGAVRFPGHEAYAGCRIWRLLSKAMVSDSVRQTVSWLVAHHGIAGVYPQLEDADRSVVYSHPAIELLALLHECDHRACFTPPFPDGGHLPVYSDRILRDAETWRQLQS